MARLIDWDAELKAIDAWSQKAEREHKAFMRRMAKSYWSDFQKPKTARPKKARKKR